MSKVPALSYVEGACPELDRRAEELRHIMGNSPSVIDRFYKGAITQVGGEGKDVRAGLGELFEGAGLRGIGFEDGFGIRFAIQEEGREAAMGANFGERSRNVGSGSGPSLGQDGGADGAARQAAEGGSSVDSGGVQGGQEASGRAAARVVGTNNAAEGPHGCPG